MSIFQRMFRMGKAEVHSALDKFEDPIKMTEQGIKELKKDLNEAMTSLAIVKGQAIRLKKQAEENKRAAEDYERKAMLLIQRRRTEIWTRLKGIVWPRKRSEGRMTRRRAPRRLERMRRTRRRRRQTSRARWTS